MRPISQGIFYWERESISSRIDKMLSRITREKQITMDEAESIAYRIARKLHSGNEGASVRASVIGNGFCDDDHVMSKGRCVQCWKRGMRRFWDVKADYTEIDQCYCCKKFSKKGADIKQRLNLYGWDSEEMWGGYVSGGSIAATVLCEGCAKKAKKVLSQLKNVAASRFLINQLNRSINSERKNKDNRATS